MRTDGSSRRRRPVPSARGSAELRSGPVRRGKGERAPTLEAGIAEQARALVDPDPAVRALALQVIAEFSKAQAAELIALALFDLEPAVRCVAAECAGRVGGSRLVPALIAALGDRSPDVRRAAARSLETLVGAPIDSIADLERRWADARLSELRRDST
jgi:HEAT repeat protein